MRRGYTLVLLCGLSLSASWGCGKSDPSTRPLTEAELAERDKRVQEEERLHFQQVPADAAEPQNYAYGEQAPPGE